MFSTYGKTLMPAFPERNNAVFLCCDCKSLSDAMMTVASILAAGAKGNRYDVLVLVHDVEANVLAPVLEWARGFRNCRLRFINAGECPDSAATKEQHGMDVFPLAACSRLFAPTIFPNHDTVVYLDSGIVVLRDVVELCRHSLGNALIGACHDFAFEYSLRMPHSDPGKQFFENAARCGVAYRPGDPYFNSGVMVMNLKAMREEKTEERFLDAIRPVKKPTLPDQDVLNLVCKDRVDFIDPLWNCGEWMAGIGWDLPKTLRFAGKKLCDGQ